MIKILCYGDSNTWGYISGSDHQRYGENERWTKILAKKLGYNFEIIEEGLNSRTLISNDERQGKEGKNGSQYLIPCLDTHDPIDLVIIMLGTNELKKVYNKSMEEIGELFEKYFVKVILNRKSQIDNKYPKLLIITPPIVSKECGEKYEGAYEKSLKMNDVYKQIAQNNGCYFIDNTGLQTGIDGVHLTKESHQLLADKVYNKIKEIKLKKEIWNILDEEGNVTGKTMEKGDKIVWQEGIYHQGADVWIINSKGKILIQKRSPQKKLEPNVWAMTGGSVIKGETSLETLKRETLEELGIKLNTEKAIKINHYKTGNVWLDEYIVEQEVDLKNVIMQDDEVSEVKFASYDEIEELYKNNMFMKNRWEFVRKKIKEFISNKSIESTNINKQFINFLIQAKKSTYADGTSNSKVKETRNGSKDYEYKKDNMTYHDTYFGGVRFMGEEIVYCDDIPIWGMNYYGVTFDDSLGEEAMDKALRPALMKVGEEENTIPVRGLSKFENNGYIYTFKTNGMIENFNGIEKIYKDNILIYELHCSGGIIK